ncbi:MAG: twin transmembrane helix small protein [Parvularcula sp.]|jgi:hypothetical protein|nr:twin transmembrane helix small protein [Parvularcula sp.]
MAQALQFFLIPVGLIATAIVLGLGIYSLARGGEFAKQNSNKLMRLRVVAQAITIALLMGLVYVLTKTNGGA